MSLDDMIKKGLDALGDSKEGSVTIVSESEGSEKTMAAKLLAKALGCNSANAAKVVKAFQMLHDLACESCGADEDAEDDEFDDLDDLDGV